ncbi:MAG: hypothetical protein KF708_14905 [Pirellulales bacterium]|nr:hypothetical protein [Pirellulales bacterium]
MACALVASALCSGWFWNGARGQDFSYATPAPSEAWSEHVAYHVSDEAPPEVVSAPDDAWSAAATDYGSPPCDSCRGYGGDCACRGDACYEDDCCDSCFDEFFSCGYPSGLAAGVEATYLKPDYNDSNFYLPAEYDRQAAPRIWLQGQGRSGWGIRSRYWDFDADQTRAGYQDFGDSIAAANIFEELEATAIDLELTRAFQFAALKGSFSLGARYARLQHHLTQQLTIFDLSGGGGDDVTAIFQQGNSGLEGTGMTGAIDLRRTLFGSRLAAICNLRGSYVWGQNKLGIDGAVIEAVPVGPGDLDLNDFEQLNLKSSQNDGMWIGELQAGGEWSVPISSNYGGGNAFVRVLFEAQWWRLPGATLVSDQIDVTTSTLVHEFMGVTAAAGITR